MIFEDIRNMTDKELAEWLEEIWKTGYYTSKLGGTIDDKPNFYEGLLETK